MAAAMPLNMGVVECRRCQCARMLYDQTAGRTMPLRLFGAPESTGLWASSASSGWHAGQTMGRLVDGLVLEDEARDLAET